MSDYGIQPEGFKRKRLNQILSDLNAEVKAIFGENFDVSPQSPDGQINGVVSGSYADLWEIAEESYNAFNPKAATGNALSALVTINGIERQAATATQAVVQLTGIAGAVVPAGSIVATGDGSVQFEIPEDVILNGLGEGEITVEATETGPLPASAGTITVIETPVAGWDTVNNTDPAITGSNEETDPELRSRRERSVASNSQNVVDSIFSAVGDVDGVTNVVVRENDTETTDADGVPPHHVHVVVSGGDDTEIAQQIFTKKPAGIGTFGSESVSVDDDQGIPHNIKFNRPTDVVIYVIVNVTQIGSEYPVDGDELIKQAIVDYANGELIAGRSFDLGEDVIQTELYTPVNTVPGHQIDSILIGTSSPPTLSDNITITADEIASFLTSNVTVNS